MLSIIPGTSNPTLLILSFYQKRLVNQVYIFLTVWSWTVEFLKILLAEEKFAKILRIFETCLLLDKNLRGKLASS